MSTYNFMLKNLNHTWTPSTQSQWALNETSRGILGGAACFISDKSISFSSTKCNSRPPPEANRKGIKSGEMKPYWGSIFLIFNDSSTSAKHSFVRFEWCINFWASWTICFILYEISSANSFAASSRMKIRLVFIAPHRF